MKLSLALILPCLLAASVSLLAASVNAADPSKPVKVFILAGQSNMEGQAVVDLDGKDYNNGEGMKTLGKRQMQPGMPVEVVIKTGERSLLTYLLHPLVKRLSASMKEE